MKNLVYLIVCWLAPLTAAMSQTCPDTVRLSMTVSFEGDEMIADIVADKFPDIIGFQTALHYDNQVLEVKNVSSSFIDQSNFGIQANRVVALYISSNPLAGLTLPDNSVMFSVRFKVLKESANPGFYFSEVEFVDSQSRLLCYDTALEPIITTGTSFTGSLRFDKNSNCISDPEEPGMGGWVLKLTQGDKVFYRITDNNGRFHYGLQPGVYGLEVRPRSDMWGICSHMETITIVENQPQTIDLLAFPITYCKDIKVDVATPFLRRCFDNVYTIKYENVGTLLVTDPYLEVTLDENFTFKSTSHPDFELNGNVVKFYLDDLDLFESGTFTMTVNLDCNTTVLGQTHCVTAVAFPHEPCQPNPAWTGADVEISARCEDALEKVIFKLKNTGSGDMSAIKHYIVTEDDVMSPPVPFSLDAGEEIEIELPANGSTYRLTAEEDDNFPFSDYQTLAIEGCEIAQGSNFSIGFINQFPESDVDSYIDTDCRQSIGSYDPNDITGMPAGYGFKKYVEKETKMEYLIRFQNTGTDTAFTVEVKNLIPEGLDISGIQMGVSSHPFSYRIDHLRNLILKFDNILLPDSNTNEPASHGFVKYSIGFDGDLPLESVVENFADIFFDFNPPVKTNTEFHTLGTNFVITSIEVIEGPSVLVYPNPTHQSLHVISSGDLSGSEFSIFSPSGEVLSEGNFGENKEADVSLLPPGMYFLSLKNGGKRSNVIKFVKTNQK